MGERVAVGGGLRDLNKNNAVKNKEKTQLVTFLDRLTHRRWTTSHRPDGGDQQTDRGQLTGHWVVVYLSQHTALFAYRIWSILGKDGNKKSNR